MISNEQMLDYKKCLMADLARPSPFHVFRGRTVITDNESVGALKKKTGPFQPKFNLVLLADDDKQLRVSLVKPEKGLVVSECRADEHDVIKPATKGLQSWFTRNCIFPDSVAVHSA